MMVGTTDLCCLPIIVDFVGRFFGTRKKAGHDQSSADLFVCLYVRPDGDVREWEKRIYCLEQTAHQCNNMVVFLLPL